MEDKNVVTKRLSRGEIISQGIEYKTDFFDIKYSNHCLERLEERLDGSIKFLPKVVRITENNISGGETLDGKKLKIAKIRINYKSDKWVFLVINLEKKLVLTVYFVSKIKNKNGS